MDTARSALATGPLRCKMKRSRASFDTSLQGSVFEARAQPWRWLRGTQSPATIAILAGSVMALAIVLAILAQPTNSSLVPAPPSMRPAVATSRTAVPLPKAAIIPALPQFAAPGIGSGQGDALRQGTDIIIAYRQMPRLPAALQLATLTKAQFLQGRNLLARASPVTLQWQGRDPIRAWQALLGENIRHAVHCTADGCRVSILAVDPVQGAIFTNIAASDSVVPIPASLRAGTVELIPPQAEERIGPMNTPTPPDEPSKSETNTTATDSHP